MALDPDFVADCFYGPGGQLIDEILRIDAENHIVVCRMPVSAELPITREQIVHPVRHPQHVSGALMVHATGIVGFVHAYYVLGLRHAAGWVGYGARIESARFHNIAHVPGDALVLTGRVTQLRKGATRILVKYAFEFHQTDKLVYQSTQTAMWIQTNETPGKSIAEGSESD
jgi:hypothetical protein